MLSQIHYYDSSLDTVNNFQLFHELIVLLLFSSLSRMFQFIENQLIGWSVVCCNGVFGKLLMQIESYFLLELLAKVVFYRGIEILT